MSRETENALLLLLGVSTVLITVTGGYTRYVKPSLHPWLMAAAVLVILLSLVSIARDIRHGPDHDEHDGHGHRRGMAWMLIVPIALLAFVVPPAIGPQTARPATAEMSAAVERRPFPPLPSERAPELSLPDLLIRIAQDSAGTLDGRLVSVDGFTLRDGGRTELGRVVIICCAADAQLARIILDGPAAAAAARLPAGSWVRVEGTIAAGQQGSSRPSLPTMSISHVQQIAPPANTYSY